MRQGAIRELEPPGPEAFYIERKSSGQPDWRP
jgi:hypothetical protein